MPQIRQQRSALISNALQLTTHAGALNNIQRKMFNKTSKKLRFTIMLSARDDKIDQNRTCRKLRIE